MFSFHSVHIFVVNEYTTGICLGLPRIFMPSRTRQVKLSLIHIWRRKLTWTKYLAVKSCPWCSVIFIDPLFWGLALYPVLHLCWMRLTTSSLYSQQVIGSGRNTGLCLSSSWMLSRVYIPRVTLRLEFSLHFGFTWTRFLSSFRPFQESIHSTGSQPLLIKMFLIKHDILANTGGSASLWKIRNQNREDNW